MAKIVPANNGENAISTEITANGASHHYKLIGLEIAQANDNQVIYDLIALGNGGQSQNTLAKVASHFLIDRCYIHGTTNGKMSRAIALNSAETTISNSYISEIHNVGSEAQAICGWNGPGPFTIENNYLEASTQNLMFGGADPHIPNLVPQDILIRRNYFFKPVSWYTNTPRWLVKNIFELKNARQVHVSENILENNWADGQNGFAILFTVRNQDGTAPWSTVENVTFTGNVLRNTPRAVNLLGQDDTYTSQNQKNIAFTNNLFESIGSVGTSDGKCFQITNVPQGSPGIENLLLDHNTCVGLGEYPYFIAGDNQTKITGLSIRNNIAVGITLGTDASIAGNALFGTAALNSVAATSWSLQKNVVMLPSGSSSYPNSGSNTNFYVSNSSSVGFVDFTNGNYGLSPSSSFKNSGTDGQDPGADISSLNEIKHCILSGNWSSCLGGSNIQTPFPGSSTPAVPATIEFENFDRGGTGIAYNDNFGSTGSGVYRSSPTESVDILQNSNASNGFVVFEAAAGEWMEYSLNFPTSGLFNFAVRFSSGYSQQYSHGRFRLEVCNPTPSGGVTDCEISPEITVFSTDGWSSFKKINVPLRVSSTGLKILRLVLTANAPGDSACNCVVANFDSVAITKRNVDFDLDGDLKSDVINLRPSSNDWYALGTQNGFSAVNFGLSGDLLAPADYDGDGRMDYGLYRPSTGTWWIMNSVSFNVTAVSLGNSDDVPVPADYDGDGKADVASWRPSTGEWIRINSSDSVLVSVSFGLSTDRPLIGDFDGDGKSDFAVFRPSVGSFFVLQSSAGFAAYSWGLSTDIAVPADYDGDGKTDVAVWRPSTGVWYVISSSNNSVIAASFGTIGDIAAPADFDGDGKADFAIYRPSSGTWWRLLSSSGVNAVSFGLSNDIPIPSVHAK